TRDAVNIGETVAELRGLVNPMGAATTVYFEYGTDPGLAGATQTAPAPLSGSSPTTEVGLQVTGITEDTVYYFRVVATNAGGTAQGEILSFQTADDSVDLPPSVATLSAASVDSDSTQLRASVNPNGAATDAWFEWG